MKVPSLLLAVVVIFFSACEPQRQSSAMLSDARGEAKLQGPSGETVSITVEIADDDAERSRGLMGRTSLPKGEGMLFVFEENLPLNFWMKNTLLPLDILFFDVKGAFISRTTMTPCAADPCPLYPSRIPAAFALEVQAKDSLLQGVGKGWVLLPLVAKK